jgi:hypothetical protein
VNVIGNTGFHRINDRAFLLYKIKRHSDAEIVEILDRQKAQKIAADKFKDETKELMIE